jgi:hypothetical protein
MFLHHCLEKSGGVPWWESIGLFFGRWKDMKRGGKGMEKSILLRAAEALEAAGFHVEKVMEEDLREAGFDPAPQSAYVSDLGKKTGAIVIRCSPEGTLRNG